jgi:hypothetical protein
MIQMELELLFTSKILYFEVIYTSLSTTFHRDGEAAVPVADSLRV